MDEQISVGTRVRDKFLRFREEKIAVYGLGKNTQSVLEYCKDFSIVALLDEVKIGQQMWGLPVVNCEKAYQLGVTCIIIVARAANVPIIYRRIAEFCECHNIAVFDANGIELKRTKQQYLCPEEYRNISFEKLKEKIEQNDVISFDIFDTLLMRKVLYPTDIFLLVEEDAKWNGIIGPECDFYSLRINAERELNYSTVPSIDEIYEIMVECGNISSEQKQQLMKMELAEEKKQIITRKDMKQALKYAQKLKKKICCTSDMYWTEGELLKLLKNSGYEGIDKVFVSCQYRTSKSEALFNVVKEYYWGEKVLHIGDDFEVDICGAKKSGITDTFYVKSAVSMLADSILSDILYYDDTLANRLHLGRIVANQFNSPFVFGVSNGKYMLQSLELLGRDFVAPLLECFVRWLLDETKKSDIEILLLGARDGWVIYKIMEALKDHINIEMRYFYTSRSACILAGVSTEEDIVESAQIGFVGSLQEMLIARYGLEENEVCDRLGTETDEEYLLKHKDIILKHAKKYNEFYKTYGTPFWETDKRIGYVDFVSTGTCQRWLQKIFNKNAVGFYLARVPGANKGDINLKALFEQESDFDIEHAIYKKYMLLEEIIISPEPSVFCFDKCGRVIFQKEYRTLEHICCMQKIQSGIISEVQDKVRKVKQGITREFADFILTFLNRDCIEGLDKCFDNMISYDALYNRQSDINILF